MMAALRPSVLSLLVLLSLALLFALVPGGARAQTTIDYDMDNDDLIDVSNLEQLNAMRWDLNGDGTPATANATDHTTAFPTPATNMGCQSTCTGYELTASLDFGTWDSNNPYWNGGDGWLPIGGQGTDEFATTFEGNGYTISNLYINARRSDNGLFAVTDEASEIRNVGIVNGNVTTLRGISDRDSRRNGVSRAGLLAGYTKGDVTHCWSTGSVTGNDTSNVGGLIGRAEGKVRYSYSTAGVKGVFAVGGLVGDQDGGTISASWASGSVLGRNGVGGLVGESGDIIASYAVGSVGPNREAQRWHSYGRLGGLVGDATAGTIRASYARGAIDGINPESESGNGIVHVGGLVGRNAGATITDSHFDRTATGRVFGIGNNDNGASTASNQANNVVDENETNNLVGHTTAELQTPTAYGTGIYANWNVNVDDMSGNDDPWDFGTATQYPALKADSNGDGFAITFEFGTQGRSSSPPPPANPPDQVAAPTVTAVDRTTLTVTWTAPTNTGPAITDYDVQYRESGTTAWTALDDTTPSTTLMAALSDLMAGTRYEVQVRAESTAGTGDWSPAGTASTLPNTAPVFVDPLSDRDPKPSVSSYRFELEADIDASRLSVIVGKVAATDADRDSITYNIVGGNNGDVFTIQASGSDAGQIGYTGTGETSGWTFRLTVRASDGFGHTDVGESVEIPVFITVTSSDGGGGGGGGGSGGGGGGGGAAVAATGMAIPQPRPPRCGWTARPPGRRPPPGRSIRRTISIILPSPPRMLGCSWSRPPAPPIRSGPCGKGARNWPARSTAEYGGTFASARVCRPGRSWWR